MSIISAAYLRTILWRRAARVQTKKRNATQEVYVAAVHPARLYACIYLCL
jgi:hypothetical protein